MRNSIVVNDNSASRLCHGKALAESRGNLIGDNSCGATAEGDPLLGELTGSPAYHPLGRGSAAINAADAAHCPATDQTGAARPQGAGCDIGAVEFVTG